MWHQLSMAQTRNLAGDKVLFSYNQSNQKVIYIQSSCQSCLDWIVSLEPCYPYLKSNWKLVTIDSWANAKKKYQSAFYADWILVSDSSWLKSKIPGTPTIQVNDQFFYTKWNCSQFISKKSL